MTETRQIMMLADDHVDAILTAIRRTHAPIEIIGQGGRRSIFRISRGKLYGFEITESGLVKHEVMKESDMKDIMNRPDVSRPDPVELEKNEIRTKLRADHPEMTAERISEQVDTIYEARRTALALVKIGIPPKVASNMVTNALRINETERGRLQNMAAEYAERRNTTSPQDVADPMGGIN